MLSMRGFEALAVRAMQELQANNIEQADEIAALKARLDAVEANVRGHSCIDVNMSHPRQLLRNP